MPILILAGVVNSALGGIDGADLVRMPRLGASAAHPPAAIDSVHGRHRCGDHPGLSAPVSTLTAAGPEVPGALLLILEFRCTLGHMALGFWLAERGLFAAGTRVPVTRIFTIALVVSVPVRVWTIVAGTGTDAAHEIAFRTAMIPGLMYIAGLILLLRLPVARGWLSFLRFDGRMAFSNYGHTVIPCDGASAVPLLLVSCLPYPH